MVIVSALHLENLGYPEYLTTFLPLELKSALPIVRKISYFEHTDTTIHTTFDKEVHDQFG